MIVVLPKVRVLTGAENGVFMKHRCQLLRLDRVYAAITVYVSPITMSVNPSYLEGLLKEVILINGKESFFNRYRFVSRNDFILPDVYETVDRVLREQELFKPQ